jgi:DNA invertase Pin-like site-specific DNA recombinase
MKLKLRLKWPAYTTELESMGGFRMTVRFYTRVSTEEQAVSGLGLNAQCRTCLDLASIIGVKPDDWDVNSFGENSAPGQFTDEGVSAWKHKLAERPAGKAMMMATKRGDTIIMSRLDRGFRSAIDFCQFIDYCLKNDIRFVCGSPRVNLATANGRAAAQICAVVAEWQSSINSERTKEGIATRKRQAAIKLSRAAGKVVSEPSDYRPIDGERQKPQESTRAAGGRVHIYARCSHRSSAEGHSIASQLFSMESHRARLLATGNYEMGGDFVDSTVSALKNPFRSRPNGKALDDSLQEGDQVIFVRVDRAFGTTQDFLDTVDSWTRRGVTIHFSEDGTCLNDAWGKMLLVVLSHFSEMERRVGAERCRDSRRVLKNQGMFQGGKGAPPFWRVHIIRRVQRLIPDSHQIMCYRYIMMCRRHGVECKRACVMLESHLAKREGRVEIPLHGCRRAGKYRSLPEGYVAKVAGGKEPLIYPLWTPYRVCKVRDDYPAAMERWHALTIEEKRRIKLICRKSHMNGKRIEPIERAYREAY